MLNEGTAVRRPLRILQTLLTVAMGAYALGLAIYLILRLLFDDRLWWLAFLNGFAYWLFTPLFVFLLLGLLLRARWLLGLTVPLILIGVLWIGPYYLPKAHP